MNKHGIIFGTDGWRDLMGSPVNTQNIRRVAQAFAGYIHDEGDRQKVAIGFDGRTSSEVYATDFARVLVANNIGVLLSDRIIPTPLVSFACVQEQCDAGVMITASHNPPAYNGIKFKSSGGNPFTLQQTREVESRIDRLPVRFEQKSIPAGDFTREYIRHLEKLIDFDAIAGSGMHVAIDSMAGAGSRLLEKVLRMHGIRANTIFGQPQADFGGRIPEPIARNLQPLAAMLRENRYFCGLATDGDADRLGIMTGTGHWMNIQECILYLAEYYCRERNITGPLVKTASVTRKLNELFPDTERRVIEVPVGFKYIAEAMVEHQAAFGAEESGGFGFRGHFPDRDGIFSALVFLEMAARSGHQSLDALIDEKRDAFGEIHYDRIDMENNNSLRHKVLPGLAKDPPGTIAGFEVDKAIPYTNSRGKINGLKILLKKQAGWLLMRVSETEPMVRIYAEAESDEAIKALLNAGRVCFAGK